MSEQKPIHSDAGKLGPIIPDTLYSKAQVAEMVQKTVRSLNRYIATGELKSLSVGRRGVRILGQDVINWIEKSTKERGL